MFPHNCSHIIQCSHKIPTVFPGHVNLYTTKDWLIIGVLYLAFHKNSILNKTNRSFLEFPFILRMQDFKSWKRFIFIAWKMEVNCKKFLCCNIRHTFILMCLNSFTKKIYWLYIWEARSYSKKQIFWSMLTLAIIYYLNKYVLLSC